MGNTFMTLPPTSRVGRYPKHTFNVRSRPFFARPFMIAPVLPAETLQSMYMETRCITDPVLNPIIGWKKEYFFFYVRMSDLLEDAIKEMFIDPANAALPAAAATVPNIHYQPAAGGYPWLEKCMKRIMLHYFWDEGSDLYKYFDGYGADLTEYPVYYRDTGIFDSITDKDDMPAGADIEDATNMQNLEALQTAFEHLRAMGLANMSYEDFLRTYGINIKDPTEGKPEHLWHLSEFQYPSNTIDPTTGAPTSAVSWVFKQSTRDRKFFTEPGFIVGLTVTRPKLYMGGQSGNASAFLQRAWDWMPALLATMPETRLKKFDATGGPVIFDPAGEPSGFSDSYWLDMCDLFIHGDQFMDAPGSLVTEEGATNMVTALSDHQIVAPHAYNENGPSTDVAARYVPAPWEMTGIFADETGTASHIREDGFVSLNIKGKQIDLTETAGFKQGM